MGGAPPLLADSLWQDIAGYSTTRRNLASNSNLSAYSFTGSGDYCNKINDYTWSMKSSVSYAGIQINGALFEQGETYSLSYRYTKQSGILENMGGHSTGFTTLYSSQCMGENIMNKYIYGTSNENTPIENLNQTFQGFYACGATFAIAKNDGYTDATNNDAVGVLFNGTISFN